MRKMIRSLARRYGVAMVVSALALVITYTIGLLTERHTFMLGFAAVTVSAWYGGLGPGIAATAVSSLVIAYIFVPPAYSLAMGVTDAALLGVFVGVAALITGLITDRKRSQDALRRAHEALENQVQERTASLAHTNEALQAEITQRQEAEAALALRLADNATIANQNARLYAEAGRRQREAEGLAEVGYLLAQSLDPAEVAQRIVESVRKLFHARAAGLYLLEAGSGDLMQVALSGHAKVDAGQSRLPRGVGVGGLAVRERQPVVTQDALNDPRITYPPHVQAALAEVRSQAVLSHRQCVPAVIRGCSRCLRHQ
ncbi:MAG: DUF4118 domain-containing protein, partial [Nitrospinae bacterium]|nr:DUF4118 domain-containing protein [Nitrospinota bacterium]